MTAITDFKMGDLVDALVHYRTEIDEITAETNQRTARPKKMLEAIQSELLRRASSEGLTAVPCDAGTLSVVDTTRYNISDPADFQKFILGARDLSYLGKNVSKPAVEEYQKQHGDLPPGIGAYIQRTLRFTARK